MATKKQQTPANAAQSDETDVQAPSRPIWGINETRELLRPIWGINETRELLRKIWEPLVNTGGVNCSRCNKPITGNFDLGHRPGLPSHPEHPHCNRSAH